MRLSASMFNMGLQCFGSAGCLGEMSVGDGVAGV